MNTNKDHRQPDPPETKPSLAAGKRHSDLIDPGAKTMAISQLATAADIVSAPLATHSLPAATPQPRAIPSLAAVGSMEGCRLGHYQIGKELGRGGMGVVYQAVDTRLERSVAMKFLHVPHYSLSEQGLQRFLREARLVARLDHPNIVRILEVGELEGLHFFTMELVTGPSLQKLLAAKKVGLKKGVLHLLKMTRAVQYAHDKGIIHRDLKPGNILENAKGEPIVMDFGLAKIMEEPKENITKSDAILGTLVYMSPEQATGLQEQVDFQSDVYSLGAILYEILSGCQPFVGSPLAILKKIALDEPIAPTHHNPKVPQALENICRKAMAKDKKKRYPSAQDLAMDLERFLRGKEVTARPTSLAKPQISTFSWLAIVFVAGTVLGILLATKGWQRVNALSPTVIADKAEVAKLKEKPAANQQQPTAANVADPTKPPPTANIAKVADGSKPTVVPVSTVQPPANPQPSPTVVPGKDTDAVATNQDPDATAAATETAPQFPQDTDMAKSPTEIAKAPALKQENSIGSFTPLVNSPIWQAGWEEKNGYFDFTDPGWTNLPLHQQFQYAQEYQRWYARFRLGLESIEKRMVPANAAFEMVLVPPGKFWMGAASDEKTQGDDEGPRHAVLISTPFWLSRYEITQKQWYAIVGEKPWRRQPYTQENPTAAASFVCWDDIAKKFLPKLGEGFGLPTEAQWEYACRAGTSTPFYWGDESNANNPGDYAWYDANANDTNEAYTHTVGQKKPNHWGVYDMIGNVAEWCHDQKATYALAVAVDPAYHQDDANPVIRGGRWNSSLDCLRSAYRDCAEHDARSPVVGLRLTAPVATGQK